MSEHNRTGCLLVAGPPRSWQLKIRRLFGRFLKIKWARRAENRGVHVYASELTLQKEASAGDKRGGSNQRLPSAPRVGAV
jgi:hypothetical protein